MHERPLHTTWRLAPSRSLTPDGKLRQDQGIQKTPKEINHDQKQITSITVLIPTKPLQQQQVSASNNLNSPTYAPPPSSPSTHPPALHRSRTTLRHTQLIVYDTIYYSNYWLYWLYFYFEKISIYQNLST